MWGYGVDLHRAYRLLRIALVCLVVLLLANALGVADAAVHGSTLRLVIAVVRLAVNAVILVLGVKGSHALSVLAERANVYRGVIERGLPPRRRHALVLRAQERSDVDLDLELDLDRDTAAAPAVATIDVVTDPRPRLAAGQG